MRALIISILISLFAFPCFGKAILFDDFSTDTSYQYDTYSIYEHGNTTPADVSVGYDASNHRSILTSEGGYSNNIMSPKCFSVIDPSLNFTISMDFETLNEFNSLIYVGNLKTGDQANSLTLRADHFLDDHIVHYKTINGVKTGDSVEVETPATSGQLKLERRFGTFLMYFNNELMFQETADYLDNTQLYWGVGNRISSGPAGWTAKNAVDNLSFTSSPVPVPAAFWLLGSGLAGLLGFRRTFRSRSPLSPQA